MNDSWDNFDKTVGQGIRVIAVVIFMMVLLIICSIALMASLAFPLVSFVVFNYAIAQGFFCSPVMIGIIWAIGHGGAYWALGRALVFLFEKPKIT